MFEIEKRIKNSLGRAGKITTEHGVIETPAFATVATRGAIKALTVEENKKAGSQVILCNTYHLSLRPGDKLIKEAGGLHKFLNWSGPIITDSGGFQVFSLGAAYGKQISKITKEGSGENLVEPENKKKVAFIDEDGVNFRDPVNGKAHRLTPEISIGIQHNLGADIIFAFDECPSPLASYEYQKEAMDRTHRWAERSLAFHKTNGQSRIKRFAKSILKVSEEESPKQYLFGIVQGGRFKDLRKESAQVISKMDFDGFGIGGSFQKEDMSDVLKWTTSVLPEEKPRHMLGIGEPMDILSAIENGADLFDCVLPTRLARNGALFTKYGRINILNRKYVNDLEALEKDCECGLCQNYSRAYLAHLMRSGEILGAMLATSHNIHFINKLFRQARESILNNNFPEFRKEFEENYNKKDGR